MVKTMTVKVMMALVMMPVMVMLVMAMIMRPLPLGPLVGLPVGPRNVCGVCRNYEAVPCGRGHWALWWSSPWGPVTHGDAPTCRAGGARPRLFGPSAELPMGPPSV